MANTRETLGDQATVDGLVNHTLTTLEEDGVVTLGASALRNNTALTSVTLPGANTISSYAFGGCTNLEVVNLSGTGTKTINANAFNGCTKLQHVLINSSAMSTLSATSAFTSTPIARKDGAIYVPSSLISNYKANTNWKNYFIADINDYPLSVFESISDSWAEIIANANYATDYAVGDTKSIDLGTEGVHLMVLVAKDTDDKADSSGKARMTWISNTLLSTTHRMNPSNNSGTSGTGGNGGWENCEMRTYLKNTIKPLIPQVVRDAIVEVTKIQSTVTNSAMVKDGQTTTDDVWIPSIYEVFGTTTYESSGALYTGYFTNATARIKYLLTGSAGSWWTRSAGSTTNFRSVSRSGSDSNSSADLAYGVALGFCI